MWPAFFILNNYADDISMRIDNIILDIDGTIWNTTEIVAEAWNKSIRKKHIDAGYVTAQILQKEFGKTMDVIACDLWSYLPQEERKSLMDLCCYNEHIYVEKNTKDITYPYVIDTIKNLSNKVNFFVVSNCQNGYIELMLDKTNLKSYIKDYECYGRTLKGKAFNITDVINRNNLKNTVYIGDTKGDSEACRDARIPFIWASYGFGLLKNDEYYRKLNNFADIKTIMEE